MNVQFARASAYIKCVVRQWAVYHFSRLVCTLCVRLTSVADRTVRLTNTRDLCETWNCM